MNVICEGRLLYLCLASVNKTRDSLVTVPVLLIIVDSLNNACQVLLGVVAAHHGKDRIYFNIDGPDQRP